MKNVRRARQALAQDQAAWNSTMQKGKIVHYLINKYETACGSLYDGIESRAAVELRGVTCQACHAIAKNMHKEKCIASKVHYLIDDTTLACGLPWEMENVGCSTIADVTCGACIAAHAVMQYEQEESMASKNTVTLYTLAPASLDKPGAEWTRNSPWLYSDANVPEQALREVLVPHGDMVAQMQAYRLKVPYITFSEEGLAKALAKGLVYRADNGVSGVAFDPIKAAIEFTNKKKEDTTMTKKPVVKIAVKAQPKAVITEVHHANMPAPSALDAILATPLRLAEDDAAIAELKARMDTPKKALALPEERSEQALVHDLAPAFTPAYSLALDPLYVQLAQLVVGLQNKVASLEERLSAMHSAPMPSIALTMHDILSNVWDDIVGSVPVPDKAPVVPDAWGDMLGEMQAPARPKSTLQVFTGGNTSNKAARQGGSKTDPAIIKAIQQAWKGGKVTQAALAQKYGMDDKRVWFIIHRAEQLV